MRQDEYFVASYDSIEAVSDCDHCAFRKFFFNQLLDLLFCHYVNIGCSFIQDNDSVLSQYSSADTDKLTFTCAEICTSFTDFEEYAYASALSIKFTNRAYRRLLSLSFDLIIFDNSCLLWLAIQKLFETSSD